MSYLDPVKPPLSFLFEDKTHSSFSSTVKDKATSEAIRYHFQRLCFCACLYVFGKHHIPLRESE